jgi:hypothetical protein
MLDAVSCNLCKKTYQAKQKAEKRSNKNIKVWNYSSFMDEKLPARGPGERADLIWSQLRPPQQLWPILVQRSSEYPAYLLLWVP